MRFTLTGPMAWACWGLIVVAAVVVRRVDVPSSDAVFVKNARRLVVLLEEDEGGDDVGRL